MIKCASTVLAGALLVLSAAPARAQTAGVDVTTLSLQELLDAQVTSTASKFPQSVTTAPASITIVTAEEIRRFGHRTLADVLRGVRGLYVTDDRNYTYTGVRGFGRPGDYNTRVLLLVDGHRMNDPIYDMAPVGTDLPIDIEAIDRIEIIRGPGSALYGTNAFFAVINVITRIGGQDSGAMVSSTAGTLGSRAARASFGHVFGNGADLWIGASAQGVDGLNRLYFPEFDSPLTNGGVVLDADRDTSARVFGALSVGHFTFHVAQGQRQKHVPTAPFATIFGDPRLMTRDSRGYADVNYSRTVAGGWNAVARASYDRYHYRGGYPYDYGDLGVDVLDDRGNSDWLGSELTASRRVGSRQHLTFGGEVRYALREDQTALELSVLKVFDQRKSGTWGVYGQDDVSLTSQLTLTAGARVDRYSSFGSQVTPRVALVYTPSHATTFKVGHGKAFRAPNAYELYYFAPPASVTVPELEPETLLTTEGTWEQYYGPYLRSTVSLFHSDIRNLISQQALTTDDIYFANVSSAQSVGVESELEARTKSGITARGSYTWTNAHDGDSVRLSNSPVHMTKYETILPLVPSRVFLATSGAYTSTRLSIRGSDIPGFYVQNLTVTADHVLDKVDLSIGVYNVFDRRYGDPAAEEHAQIEIPQNGRTVRAGLTVKF